MKCPNPKCNSDKYLVKNTVSIEDPPGFIERIRYMECEDCGYKDKEIWYLTRDKPYVAVGPI